MINLDELTYGQIKELKAVLGANEPTSIHPYKVGEKYFISTVTKYYSGVLVKVTAQELVLKKAAWVADTGRLAEQWAKGPEEIFDEVEPYPGDEELIVGRGTIADAVRVNAIPASQK